ncbi:hypothetical protein E6H11_01055 [Candidatus Bathyarchaeota archaeon]|nr:MAG: hypothetical protein E6H11_01055 [Candidatus Bathyarchaeota archaeon]
MSPQGRVLAVALVLGGWVIGAVLVAGFMLFFGPPSGCPLLLIPVGSTYVCNVPPWIGIVELLFVLGFFVTYLIIIPLLTFSRMIDWASSDKLRNTCA